MGMLEDIASGITSEQAEMALKLRPAMLRRFDLKHGVNNGEYPAPMGPVQPGMSPPAEHPSVPLGNWGGPLHVPDQYPSAIGPASPGRLGYPNQYSSPIGPTDFLEMIRTLQKEGLRNQYPRAIGPEEYSAPKSPKLWDDDLLPYYPTA